jgi:HAMP domain-containing protein
MLALAEGALRLAAQALEVDAAQAIVAAGAGPVLSFQIGTRKLEGKESVIQAVLGEAVGVRYLRVDDALYQVATAQAGRGVSVAFGLPVDARFLERVKGATGADVTLAAGAKSISTLPPADVAGVAAAARKGSGAAVDIGRMGLVRLPVSGAPGVSLLFVRAPAWRARALPLPGLDGAPAVLSVATRPMLEPLGVYQQVSIAGLAVLFLVGLVLGALPERAVTAHVPRELAGAAERIAHGDFDARVPRMSGTFGALAAALNRATDAARGGRAAAGSAVVVPPPPAPGPALTLDVPMMAVSPQDEALPPAILDDPFARGGMAAPGPSTPAAVGPRNGTDPSHFTPLPTMPVQRTGTARFEAAEPLARQTAVRPPPPPPPPPPVPVGDDEQWQAVFQEFLKVREQCGESLDGLTWDRFRLKLQKNRDSLVQKYACRTVRFQVYVKEGKAALKATPVR